MAQENVEIVRRCCEAFDQGDHEAALDALAPDVEYDLSHFPDGRIYRVPEGGGDATAITELLPDQQETRHTPGFFLQDGRRFAYMARNTAGTKSMWYLASLDSLTRTPLLEALSTIRLE